MDVISSDDEFDRTSFNLNSGSYDPTTPRPARKATATRNNRTSNAVAGPSTKPAPAPKRGVKRGKQGNGDQVEAVDLRSDEEVREAAPPPKKIKTVTAAKPPADKVGPPNAKPKGKGKASGSDDVQIVEPPVEREIPSRATKPQAKAKGISKPPPAPGVSAAEHERLKQQLERLQKQLDERKGLEQKLTDQLEEVFRLRNTEPEEQLAREREVLEAKVQKLELLNAEQATFISGSNSGFLHFLSREDADREKKEAEDNVLHWKKTSAKKDELIKELQEYIQMLQHELNLEIERAKTLTARNPPANGRRGGTMDPDDRTHAAVISLYEAVSNVLIVNASVHPSQHSGKDEYIFQCIYSAPNPTDDMIPALHFSLRDMWERHEESGEIIRKVEYTPKDLDKERPELVEQLQFFAEPFIFVHDQLHVFFKTMSERFEEMKTGEDDDDDEEVEEVVGKD